jgi:DNA polymerase-4
MDRNIIHMDLDSFFVSVSRLLNSSLIGKPVLIGGSSDRGVVASCSYEARQFGIRSAMPMRLAKKLCPEALVVRGDFDQYSKYSRMVTEVIAENVPGYEKASIDEFYIDMSGMERFFGTLKMASELKQKIMHHTGLPISFGLSSNKTVSKIATGEAKPNGQKHIEKGSEKQFLAPLPIKKIPMVGEKTCNLLNSMGVEKIYTLQQMPVEMLEAALGQNGTMIWQKANGIDFSPVVPYSERKSISTERTFEQDTIDINFIQSVLVSMAEELGFSLRKQQKLSGCIAIKIRYANFDTHTQQISISYTSLDEVLIEKAKKLFQKIYNRRMRIRLVGLKVSDLVSGTYQIDLFNDTSEKVSLSQALDKINLKYGAKTICRAITVGINRNHQNLFH